MFNQYAQWEEEQQLGSWDQEWQQLQQAPPPVQQEQQQQVQQQEQQVEQQHHFQFLAVYNRLLFDGPPLRS
jgi:hypothetical protein